MTDEIEALRATATELVRREIAPHLQEWEDAGEVPRALHATAGELGLIGLAFPEEVGGGGGDLMTSVHLQEAMFEAGASSGLMAALFTAGIALPHIAASGNADLVDRFVRPTLAGETIGSLAITEPGGGSDVARITTARGARRRPLRRQRRQDLHHLRRPRRLRHHRRPHRRARPRGHLAAGRREGHARLHRRPVAAEDGLALLRHRRAVVRRRAGAGRQPGRRGELRLRPDRRPVRRRADRAGRARLRHRRAGARPDGGLLP